MISATTPRQRKESNMSGSDWSTSSVSEKSPLGQKVFQIFPSQKQTIAKVCPTCGTNSSILSKSLNRKLANSSCTFCTKRKVVSKKVLKRSKTCETILVPFRYSHMGTNNILEEDNTEACMEDASVGGRGSCTSLSSRASNEASTSETTLESKQIQNKHKDDVQPTTYTKDTTLKDQRHAKDTALRNQRSTTDIALRDQRKTKDTTLKDHRNTKDNTLRDQRNAKLTASRNSFYGRLQPRLTSSTSRTKDAFSQLRRRAQYKQYTSLSSLSSATESITALTHLTAVEFPKQKAKKSAWNM